MKSLKLSAAETWRLSKIEEETDSSNPSSPFKQASHRSSHHSYQGATQACLQGKSRGTQNDDDGYEKVPKSLEEWEVVKRQAVKAEEAVRAFKSKYDSLEKTRKPPSTELPCVKVPSPAGTPYLSNHLNSLSLTQSPGDIDEWADIPLPPAHILNNTLPPSKPPTHTLPRTSSLQVNSNPSSPSISKHIFPPSPSINLQKQLNSHQLHKQQHQRQQQFKQQQHKQQQQQQQKQQQLQQHKQQHMLITHELLQMETFYRGFRSEVCVCACTATLLRRVTQPPCHPSSNKQSTPPVISSPITMETEWTLLKEGVPLFVLDSGDARRQRRLQLIVAERGTGFPLWKDSIDHLSNYQSISERLHTLQASHDHSCLLALLFSHPASSVSFFQSFQNITSNNHDIFQVSKKKKKKKAPLQTKLSIRKTDISQPCCFTHITKVEGVDPCKH